MRIRKGWSNRSDHFALYDQARYKRLKQKEYTVVKERKGSSKKASEKPHETI